MIIKMHKILDIWLYHMLKYSSKEEFDGTEIRVKN